MTNSVIYAVVQIPIDVNSKICSTSVTDPSVYHCGNGESGDHGNCPAENWCFARWTGIGTLNCSCVPAVDLPAVQGSKPNPYNWIAGLVNIPSGTTGPSVVLPSVNGNLPHNLPSGTATVLDNSFTAYADQTPITLVNGNTGVGYLIVVYDASWFINSQDVTTFLANPIWANQNTTFSYDNISIPTLKDQFTNNQPTPQTPGTPGTSSHSYLIWILAIIVIIIIFIIIVIIYINYKNKNKNKKQS